MGVRLPRSVLDFDRFDADVGVRCLACDRLAVFAAADVAMHFVAKGWSTAIPLTTHPFRCACGSREVTTCAVPIVCRPNPLPAPVTRLVPIYVKKPR